jgi:hypothetical protein
MAGFLQDYGLWIALAGVFIAMQWFGMGCCGGHRNRREESSRPAPSEGATKSEGATDVAPTSKGPAIS